MSVCTRLNVLELLFVLLERCCVVVCTVFAVIVGFPQAHGFSIAMSFLNNNNLSVAVPSSIAYLTHLFDDYNVTLDLILVDSDTDKRAALFSTIQMILDDEVLAVFGETNSVITEVVSLVTGEYRVPHISASTQAALFSNKTEHPTFSRVIAQSGEQGKAAAILFDYFGWKHVGLMSTRDGYASSAAHTFSVTAAALDISIDFVSATDFDTSEDDMRRAVEGAKASGIKVFWFIMQQSDTRLLMRFVHEAGMTVDGYVWVSGDSMATYTLFTDDDGVVEGDVCIDVCRCHVRCCGL